MTYLIANTKAVAFEIFSSPTFMVNLLSTDLVTSESALVTQGQEPGFGTCYRELTSYYDLHGLRSTKFSGSAALLVKHVAQYRDNLYGLYCLAREHRDAPWIEFFKDAYITCFTMELSNVFRQLMEENVDFLGTLTSEPDASDDTASRELVVLFRQWALANGLS